ncbi:MAG: hypothetical protein H0U95_07350 [Bacteroidetes bacterium]|nr:hypothetical protein [Bacteroidota bacterium]
MKFFLGFILLCSFQKPECIDISGAKFVSVNCNVTNCFSIISNCKYLKYRIDIFNREGTTQLFKFETKDNDIEKINIYMNNLRTDSTIESGTYYAKISAYRYTDTTVKTFLFGLFKPSIKRN